MSSFKQHKKGFNNKDSLAEYIHLSRNLTKLDDEGN